MIASAKLRIYKWISVYLPELLSDKFGGKCLKMSVDGHFNFWLKCFASLYFKAFTNKMSIGYFIFRNGHFLNCRSPFTTVQDTIGIGGFPKEDMHSSTSGDVSRLLQRHTMIACRYYVTYKVSYF